MKTKCSGFPCVSVMVIAIDDKAPFPFWADNTGEIIVAGLWADTNTAILTLLLTDFNVHTKTLKLKNIHTIPVIRDFDGNIMAVFASMDINLNPESGDILEFNLATNEIEWEFLRFPTEITDDIYVAVKQNAWIIVIDQHNTPKNLSDDVYSITGGGQLVEADNTTTEVIQQAMVGVQLEQFCKENPVEGLGLMRKINTSDDKFPELGTIFLKFHNTCNGKTEVMLATGAYIGSTGKNISLNLN